MASTCNSIDEVCATQCIRQPSMQHPSGVCQHVQLPLLPPPPTDQRCGMGCARGAPRGARPVCVARVPEVRAPHVRALHAPRNHCARARARHALRTRLHAPARIHSILEKSGSVTRFEGWLPQHLVLREGEEGPIVGAVPMYLKVRRAALLGVVCHMPGRVQARTRASRSGSFRRQHPRTCTCAQSHSYGEYVFDGPFARFAGAHAAQRRAEAAVPVCATSAGVRSSCPAHPRVRLCHCACAITALNGMRYYPKLQCCVPFSPVPGSRLLTATGDPERRKAILQAQRSSRYQVCGLSCVEGGARPGLPLV